MGETAIVVRDLRKKDHRDLITRAAAATNLQPFEFIHACVCTADGKTNIPDSKITARTIVREFERENALVFIDEQYVDICLSVLMNGRRLSRDDVPYFEA